MTRVHYAFANINAIAWLLQYMNVRNIYRTLLKFLASWNHYSSFSFSFSLLVFFFHSFSLIYTHTKTNHARSCFLLQYSSFVRHFQRWVWCAHVYIRIHNMSSVHINWPMRYREEQYCKAKQVHREKAKFDCLVPLHFIIIHAIRVRSIIVFRLKEYNF